MCLFRSIWRHGRLVHQQLIQSGCESDVFVGSSLVVSMWNVGALRMLQECSIRCHLKTWSLGAPWYWDMWNTNKGRRHWNYFEKCNWRVCNQSLLLFWGCWMHVPAWLHLKRACVFITTLFKLVWSQMSFRGLVWLTCIQHVEALRMLGESSIRCHLKVRSLGLPWYWDIWNVGKGRRHWKYFGKCNRKVWIQTLLLLWGCWMHVPVSLRLKRAGLFVSRSLKVFWSPMSLWAITWLTCIQNVAALRLLG